MRLILALLMFLSFVAKAQETKQENISSQDSVFILKEKDTVHSPKKAAMLSLIPGGGQIYNHLAMPKGKKKAFWKIPIIYAGLGVTGYYAIQHHQTQKALKSEYLFRAKNGFPNLSEYASYDDQGVLTLFEKARTSRDLMIFAFAIVYGLNVLDAHVEAHFVHFDVSKNLSLTIQPKMENDYTPGVALRLSFK